MKKFIALFLCAAIALTGTACSGTAAETPAPAASDAGELSGEITVSAFNAIPHKSFLETAAAMFEEKYPGTKINVDVFSAMPEVKTAELEGGRMVSMMMVDEADDTQTADYINGVTTELMSGAGADLLSVDVLPYYKYALGGQIEDLSAYIESDADFDLDDYRSNLLDAVKINGGQYILPLDYSFELMAYDPALFTESELSALAGKTSVTYGELLAAVADGFTAGDKRVFSLSGGAGGGSLFNKLFNANYGRFVDIENKSASFDDGGFEALLEAVSAYEEQGYISQGGVRGGEPMTMERMTLAETYYKNVSNMQLMGYFNSYYNTAKVGGLQNRVVMNGSSLNDTDELLGLIANDNGEIAFSYAQAYAINSNSQNKALAWEFLKFLASEEVQSSSAASMGGVPINNNAAKEKARLEAAGQGMMAQSTTQQARRMEGQAPERQAPEDVVLTEEQTKVYDAYLAAIDEYTGQINAFFIKDAIIDSIVNAEVANYFNGTKTAAEVAGTIQNKAGLYLSE